MAKKKSAAKAAPAASEPVAVVKNKSAMIREYMAAHPDQQPKAVAEALTKQTGQEFTAAVVSTVKNQAKKKAGGNNGPAKGKKAQDAGGEALNGVVMGRLKSAAQFIKVSGGVANAKALLDAVEELKG
jgi:hypothetical protein